MTVAVVGTNLQQEHVGLISLSGLLALLAILLYVLNDCIDSCDFPDLEVVYLNMWVLQDKLPYGVI